MQKLAGGFLCKRNAVVYISQRDENGKEIGSITKELYELPSGVWQFGRNRDARVVTSIEDVKGFGEDIQTAVATWLKKIKDQPPSKPVIAGQPAGSSSDVVSGQLHKAITSMTPEMQARLLEVIQQTVGPVADSAAQGEEVNHHSSGFGQDGVHTPPARVPFTLPELARYCDPKNPAGGYLMPTSATDENGKPIMAWHETPEFAELASSATEAGVGLVKVNPDLNAALAEMDEQRALRT